jgi:hypothetical protein
MPESQVVHIWQRFVMKANNLFNFLRTRERIYVILGDQYPRIPGETPESQGYEVINLPNATPAFHRLLDFKEQKWVVGPALEPGKGVEDAKHITTDPLICMHPADKMKGRGNRSDLTWYCRACGNRWKRIPLSDYEPSTQTTIQQTDAITFGKYMGKTYRQVWDLDPAYCQWILVTAEAGEATTMIRRFAQYVAQMEQEIGFREIPAGRMDQEL